MTDTFNFEILSSNEINSFHKDEDVSVINSENFKDEVFKLDRRTAENELESEDPSYLLTKQTMGFDFTPENAINFPGNNYGEEIDLSDNYDWLVNSSLASYMNQETFYQSDSLLKPEASSQEAVIVGQREGVDENSFMQHTI